MLVSPMRLPRKSSGRLMLGWLIKSKVLRLPKVAMIFKSCPPATAAKVALPPVLPT